MTLVAVVDAAARRAALRVASRVASGKWCAQAWSCREFLAAQSIGSPLGQGVSSRAATRAPEVPRSRKVLSKPVVHWWRRSAAGRAGSPASEDETTTRAGRRALILAT